MTDDLSWVSAALRHHDEEPIPESVSDAIVAALAHEAEERQGQRQATQISQHFSPTTSPGSYGTTHPTRFDTSGMGLSDQPMIDD